MIQLKNKYTKVARAKETVVNSAQGANDPICCKTDSWRIGSVCWLLRLRFSYKETHLHYHAHRFLLPVSRPVVRRVPTCTTTACCCPAESTSSEGWSSYVARWPRKVTTLIQLMLKRMTQTSGGVEQIQTTQTGGKATLVLGSHRCWNIEHVVLFLLWMYLSVSH